MSRKSRNNKKRLRKKIKRSRTKIEDRVAQFLTDLGYSYKQNHKLDKYSVDFFVEGRYVIECYGDFWHCNPVKYDSDYYNRGLKCEAHVRWTRDDTRQQALEKMGFGFLALWETDINGSSKYCKSKIKRHLTYKR